LFLEKEDFLYYKATSYKDMHFWYCSAQKKMCGAVLMMDLNLVPLARRVLHNHGPLPPGKDVPKWPQKVQNGHKALQKVPELPQKHQLAMKNVYQNCH
jgi:hypothetical protein